MLVPPPADSAEDRRAEILAIFSREVGVAPERLQPDATLDSLEIASLDIVQAIFAIEERYDVQIPVVPDRAGSEFTTVGQLLDHVLATLERGGPPSAAPAARTAADTAAPPPPSSAGTDTAA